MVPAVMLAAVVLASGSTARAQSVGSAMSQRSKVDSEITGRARVSASWRRTRVIVQTDGQGLPTSLLPYARRRLGLIDSYVLDMPDSALGALAVEPHVRQADFDRPAWAADYLSTNSTAANFVPDTLGYTGAGITVAVIDSGISTWHDDLTTQSRSGGDQRVRRFVDLVNGQTQPYDDHGHGSHVAGIILGNGYDSNGRHAGMAPEASLVALKVLDQNGQGTISTIIAALDWVASNAQRENIRVVNLSAGAGVTQSYWTDPLTLAAKRLVDQGIVVVAAAGNLGKNAQGQKQYGGILSPGNAPWVLTVGASSTEGTVKRRDDKLADFSSLGPTRGDYLAKPDLLAAGRGILSLAVPGSSLYNANSGSLVQGTLKTGYPPYLSLSGTSMAAPQVAGAVALMLQANSNLTPNLVKAILQYTAQTYPGYGPLEQGAGFLDVLSAVRLAKFYDRNRSGSAMPLQSSWSRHIIWGNHLLSGGYLNPLGNAWAANVVWGSDVVNGAKADDNIVWGTQCGGACDNIVWGTADANGKNLVWGAKADDNIVWGTKADDNIVWGTKADDNIVWGTDCGGANCERTVWGARADDNIVWGTAAPDDNIVWGTKGDDNIVWGTKADDNIVWGTKADDNIVWGTKADDNIVWGTAAGDNIVWGTSAVNNVLWGPGGIFDLGLPPSVSSSRWWR